MGEQEQKALVFISYAYQDKKLKDKLENHLTDLKYRRLIATWSDREIRAGEVATQQIDIVVNKAHIILFLVSSDFLASNSCYGAEMKSAVERHERKEADVIPILLRPVVYESAPFAKLQVLPTNGKPVTLWRNRDRAFVDIACGIAEVAQKRFPWPTTASIIGSITLNISASTLLQIGLYFIAQLTPRWTRRRRYYDKAIQAYRAALSQNPHDATAFRGMGHALYALKRYEEALNAFQQAILFGSASAAYAGLGDTLTKLKRYSEAVAAYEQAVALDPTVTFNHDLTQVRTSCTEEKRGSQTNSNQS